MTSSSMLNDPWRVPYYGLSWKDVTSIIQAVNKDILPCFESSDQHIFFKLKISDMMPILMINLEFAASATGMTITSIPIFVKNCVQIHVDGTMHLTHEGGTVLVEPNLTCDAPDITIKFIKRLMTTIITRIETYMNTHIKKKI